MSILIRCKECKTLNSERRLAVGHFICSACKNKVPATGRDYYVEAAFKGRRVRQHLGLVTKDYALSAEVELKRELAERKATPQRRLCWKDVVHPYLQKLQAEGRNEQYQADAYRYLMRWSDFWGRDKLIDEIKPTDVRAFRVMLLESGGKRKAVMSKASVDRYHSAAKAAWNYSVDDVPNPFSRVPLFHPDNTVTNLMAAEEAQRLLKAARGISQHLYEIILVAMGTGLRKSNVLKLRRDEVNFQTNTIRVIQKGGKEHTLHMADCIRTLLASIPENGSPWFWIASNGQPYQSDWRYPWETAKKAAGIDQQFRFHDLRHLHGMLVYGVTRDLQAAQRALGHTQLSTTQRYAKAVPEYLRNSVNTALNGFLGNGKNLE